MAEEGDPLVVTSGDGIRVSDASGGTWIDVNGGYASVHAGYGRTEIADAAYEQMKRLAYFPPGTTVEPVVRLAEKLARITPGDLSRVYFVSGGSEANESAVKIAKAYHQRTGSSGRYQVISRRGSYHGAHGVTTWLGGTPGASRSDYGPPPPGMLYAPQPYQYRCEFNTSSPSECAERCARAVEDLIVLHRPQSIAAVIAEPVATPPGAAVPGDEYWPLLREICTKYEIVLIADEVVTGFGRTGRMFGCEHWGVEPDVMTVAKGIVSSYLPIGAAIATSNIADAFSGGEKSRPLSHTLTFSGHPVAAAAALKNIEIIESEALVENSAAMGAYFLECLEGIEDRHRIVGAVRGIGLLLAVELVRDRATKAPFGEDADIGARLTAAFRARGLILRVTSGVISLAPPLIVTRDDIDEIVAGLDESIGEVAAQLGAT